MEILQEDWGTVKQTAALGRSANEGCSKQKHRMCKEGGKGKGNKGG
jgi:hypothetical protein